MIFVEKYALSLYYILKSKKLYYKKIINFLKELPVEMLENIRTEYNKKICGIDDSIERSESFYNFPSSNDLDIYYKFKINADELDIYKCKIVDGFSQEMFGLSLSLTDPNYIEKMNINDRKYLGSICIGQYPKASFIEIDCDIKKTHFGSVISSTYVLLGNLISIKLYRPINIESMSNEICREEKHSKTRIRIKNNVE